MSKVTDLDLYRRGAARPRIYVSGPMARAPYTGPRAAFLLAQKLWDAGWHPIVPHGNVTGELVVGTLDADSADGCGGWLEYDFSMMADCCFLVRVTSEGMEDIPSSGTDREIALAQEPTVGITVLTEAQALMGPACWWPQAYDVTGHFVDRAKAAEDALKEADDALRAAFPELDHTTSIGERIEYLATWCVPRSAVS